MAHRGQRVDISALMHRKVVPMLENRSAKKSRFTLTIDCGLMRESNPVPAVVKLRRWEEQGKIVIFESDRAKSTGPRAPAPATTRRTSWISRPRPTKSTGRINFRNISAILFPCRDPLRLNINEINDISRLLHHHNLERSIFVTTNSQNFIEYGKQASLASMKLIVLTPDEAVRVIEDTGISVSSGADGDEKRPTV